MKTIVLIVSRHFPKTHKRAGEPTLFVTNLSRLFIGGCEKIHTIRSNYELWQKRVKDINDGKAVLSVRYWSGLPYRSKQIEFIRLEKVGIEKLEMPDNFVFAHIGGRTIDWGVVAKNDGLSFDDFCDWFKVRQKEPMAVVHFTDFRYELN